MDLERGGWCRSRGSETAQTGAQELQSLRDLVPRDDIRRQEAQHVAAGAVGDQSVAVELFLQLLGAALQAQALDQTQAAQLAHDRELAAQFLQAGAQLGATRAHVLEQAVLLDLVQEAQRAAAGQRAAREGRAVVAGLERARELA